MGPLSGPAKSGRGSEVGIVCLRIGVWRMERWDVGGRKEVEEDEVGVGMGYGYHKDGWWLRRGYIKRDLCSCSILSLLMARVWIDKFQRGWRIIGGV